MDIILIFFRDSFGSILQPLKHQSNVLGAGKGSQRYLPHLSFLSSKVKLDFAFTSVYKLLFYILLQG
jgi:hypothetical protein